MADLHGASASSAGVNFWMIGSRSLSIKYDIFLLINHEETDKETSNKEKRQ